MLAPKVNVIPAKLDVLRGANAIAAFMETNPARIYRLHRESALPTFLEGATICARRTTLVAWIERQELMSSRQP